MPLSSATFLGRMLQRLGRFGIAILSLIAFFVAAGGLYLMTSMTMGVWYPKATVVAGFLAGAGVYKLADHFDLIPESPDKIITLDLTDDPTKPKAPEWRVSGDS